MFLQIKVSADIVCGVVLDYISEVFTHPFIQCSFSVSNILFETYMTGDTVDNVVGFAATAHDGVVVATSDGTSDCTRSVKFHAISAAFIGAEIRL